jgi:hypothetical protein
MLLLSRPDLVIDLLMCYSWCSDQQHDIKPLTAPSFPVAVVYHYSTHQRSITHIRTIMATAESTSKWRDLELRTKKVLSLEINPTPENILKCN